MGDIEQGKITTAPPAAATSADKSSLCTSVTCSLEEGDEVDLEKGSDVAAEVENSKVISNLHLAKKEKENEKDEVEERDCRICHLSIRDGSEYGSGIELGCCCKQDLAAAHSHCAETWFKIRGNKTCEICGSIARNVVGVNEVELMEQWNEANDTTATAAIPPHPAETRHFWQGHKFLNFLLACMVFAFVISWLFHFNVPS